MRLRRRGEEGERRSRPRCFWARENSSGCRRRGWTALMPNAARAPRALHRLGGFGRDRREVCIAGGGLGEGYIYIYMRSRWERGDGDWY